MEKLRRALKIFWTEHGTPILAYTIIIVIIIVVVQVLNRYAIYQQQTSKKIPKQNTIASEQTTNNEEKEDKDETAVIRQFIDYCKNNQIEQAYELLSEDCKKELYPTISDFTKQYYHKRFNIKREIEINFEKEHTYTVLFYDDILEAGKVEKRSSTNDEYKIENGILENKIYIRKK